MFLAASDKKRFDIIVKKKNISVVTKMQKKSDDVTCSRATEQVATRVFLYRL